MSEPLEFDFAQIKIGDGDDPEAFTVICDIAGVTVSEAAQTSQRFRRDCTLPGKPPTRKSRTTGTTWDISGTGLVDATQNATLRAANGRRKNYQVLVYEDDGTDAGNLLGTYSGEAIMTSREINMDREGESGQSISLEGQGTLTYVAE